MPELNMRMWINLFFASVKHGLYVHSPLRFFNKLLKKVRTSLKHIYTYFAV